MEFVLIGIVAFGVIIIVIIAIIVSLLKKARNKVLEIDAVVKPYWSAIKSADQEQISRPKSLSGTENIHRIGIDKDFPEMNIDVAKTLISNFLPEYFLALSTGDIDRIRDNCSSQFCDKILAAGSLGKTTYKDVLVHKVVVSDYRKNSEEATISFQAALQYKSSKKKRLSQEKYTILYSYYLDYGDEGENVSLTCNYCGAPLEIVGAKVCPYCGAEISASIVRTWKITDVKYLD